LIKTEINLQENSGTVQLFYDGEKAGNIEFIILQNGDIDIEHTIVDSRFGGKGLGKELVLAAVSFAKEKGIKIRTSCPFAAKVFVKTPDLQSVWLS
jgi:predicted GNAT family acetyltransferase